MVLNNFCLTAVYVKNPEGGYTAYVEEISGANTQGETLEEARENLKEAIYLVMEANKMLASKTIESNNIIKEPLILNSEA